MTTGSEWVFTKTRHDILTKQSHVELSESYSIILGSAKEVLQEAIKPILLILVRMTIDQIAAVSLNMLRVAEILASSCLLNTFGF